MKIVFCSLLFALTVPAFAAPKAPKFEMEKGFDRQNLIADMKIDGDSALKSVQTAITPAQVAAELLKADLEMKSLGSALVPGKYSYTIYR